MDRDRGGLFGFASMKPATGGNRTFLYVAGAFNFGAALILVTLARVAPPLLGVDAPSASQLLYVDLAALLVAGFGTGYVLAGVDLARFWPFISLGALCKAGVAALALGYFVAGRTGPPVVLLAAGDAVFAVLFVRLLRAHAVP
jgi:hypothetical protein